MSLADTHKASFAPVVDERTRLLVLGSLPGEISLQAAQYYANPRNQFWRLMEAVTGQALVPLPYEARLRRLRAAGVGLWDVVASAQRRGSLDTNIRGHVSNRLDQLAATLPNLRALAFNGGKASVIGRRQLGLKAPYALIDLPSSSPAHTLPFDAKHAAWVRLSTLLE